MTRAEMDARLAAVEAEMRSIHESAGDEPLTEENQTRWNELVQERSTLLDGIRRDDERRAVAATLAARPASTEGGDGAAARNNVPEVIVRRDPFAVLEDRNLHGTALRRALTDANLSAIEGRDLGGAENEKHFERLLRRHSEDTRWSANLLGRSREEYQSGFAKLMTGRGDMLDPEERAAMAVGTSTNGGLLVPTHLDPTLIITNAGTSNVIRGISRVVTLTQGNVWHGATTAGVTASWDGELAEVSDDSPAVASVSVSTDKAQALVQATIEAFQDIAGLTSDVLMLFADARDRLEGAAHATGSGSGQPKGIFTAVAASTALQVASATAATIGLVDIHSLYRTLPVRWRGRASWLMNPLYSLAIKALGTAVSASYSTDITQPMSSALLGRPLVESDDAPSAQTTTALDNEVVLGDFAGGYTVVDMPGGFAVEFIPHLFSATSNLPDGRRAWYCYWRTGADATNLAAFRMLVDTTSA